MAEYEPGMNEVSFSKFFHGLKDCYRVVPNVNWYRTAGGIGYSGEFTSNRKISLMEDSYRHENVFLMDFKYGPSSVTHVFCFSRDLPNAGVKEAWIKLS